MYMLDTNVVQYIIRRNPRVMARVISVTAPICVSGVVVEEMVVSGFVAEINNIRSGKSKADLQRTYADFLQQLKDLNGFDTRPYTNDAEAIYRSLKSGKGSAKVKAMDGRIAAHALSLGAVLVTENVADFMITPGLAVENWA